MSQQEKSRGEGLNEALVTPVLNRREFLAVTSLVATATLIPLMSRNLRPIVALQEETRRAVSGRADAHTVPSVCGMCMAQCGILIDVADNMPVRIRPNTSAPTSAMGICSRGVSGLYNTLLNPDRLTAPLVRKPLLDWLEGRIGWEEARRRLAELRGTTEGFVEVSDWWKVAEAIARKLKELADNDERHALVFLYGAWGPIASARLGVPLSRFLDVYGSPNEIQFDMPACVSTRILGHTLTGLHGHQAANPLVDYSHASCIVLIRRNNPGAGVVTTAWRLAVAASEGAKVIVFDPAFSEAASKADVWLPVRPGTDLAVILAAIRYALENPAYLDGEYLKRFTNAPHLIVTSRESKLAGLPLPVSEVDWEGYGLPADYATRAAFTVQDGATGKPMPDDLAADPSLMGTFRVRLKDGSEVECKTALTLLKEWVTQNLEALRAAKGAGDYIEAVAMEADVDPQLLRRAITTILEERATFEIGWHDPRYSNSPQLWRAVDILMALYGRIQQPGGVFNASFLYSPQSGLYTRLKLTKDGDPFYSIRGDSISKYLTKYGGMLHNIPLAPPLPGPTEKGAPAIPNPLTGAWASMMAKEGYPILFPAHQVQALYDAVVNKKPYPVKVVMIFASNPLVQNPNVELWKRVFKELELVVVHDIVLSDTALYADIVAPDMTYVERLDLPLPGIYSPFPAVSVRFPWYWKLYKDGKVQREIRLYNTRTGFELLLMVAKKLDDLGVKGRDGSAFKDNMPVGLLDEEGKLPLPRLEAFVNAIFRRVMIMDEAGNVRRLTLDDFYRNGGYLLFAHSGQTTEIVDEPWSKALGREVKLRVPVWRISRYSVENERFYWRTYHHNSPLGKKVPFPTPTGRVEIYSTVLAREVRDTLKASPLDIDPSDLTGAKSRVDPLFSPVPLYAGKAMPDYVWASRLPASGGVAIDGLVPPDPDKGQLLLVYRHGPFTHTHMATQNNPLLNSVTADHLFTAWMHPETAQKLGIADGDWVVVEPAAPKVLEQLRSAGAQRVPRMRVRVRVTRMVRRDVLYVLHGWPTESRALTVRLNRLRDFRDPDFGVTDDNYFIPMVATQLGGGYALGTGVVRVRREGGGA